MSLFRKKSIDKIVADALQAESEEGQDVLHRVLTVKDLTFFGVAAIIGAGSFSSMGQACFKGGPAVVLLFIICSVACAFAAMCYAEFASRIPVSGSAYTYAYASFGELFAWIIGWALLMEYCIGNIYVAFSWSDYFSNLWNGAFARLGWAIPEYFTCSYHEAQLAFKYHQSGEALDAWNKAPVIAGLRIIVDIPALAINAFITWLVYIGIKESKNFSNAMVMVKLIVIALVIIVGAFYVDTLNWKPFMPNGFSGVMGGVSAVFFAFIGFDAVSTLAEESKDPQRDLPRGMIYSLILCTVVYVLLSLVLTGMTLYTNLNVGDPLAEVFKLRGVRWMLYFVSIAAVVAMTSVILVFQMGQPRIWMNMSRDGLLPKKFSSIHPKYKTPGFATIVTGLVVGIPILFTDKQFVLDFTSIGTLFAFVLVCGGVLVLPPKEKEAGKFHLPYINGRIFLPLLFVIALTWIGIAIPHYFTDILHITKDNAESNVPLLIFWILCLVISIRAATHQLSVIPVLGLVSCCYLLTGMTARNWLWFFMWFAIGLVFYFCYGYRKSKLGQE